MTYEQYRQFGYLSKLDHLKCKGPAAANVSMANQLAGQQMRVGQTQSGFGEADRWKSLGLIQPLIDQQSALAGGDRNAAVAASMPQISQISAGYGAAKNSIFGNTSGAARDSALANLETQKYTGQAGAQAQAVQNAPGILAQLGQGLGGFSLQETGAGLAGFGGAAKANEGAANMMMQQSQAKMAPYTALAGIAGSAVGGMVSPGGILNKLPIPGGGGGGRSDRRLKQNIREMDPVLAAIAALQIVQFEYNQLAAPHAHEQGENIGVIAQDLEKLFPQAVYHEGRYKSVNYGMLGAVALKGIQELAERVEALEEAAGRSRIQAALHTALVGAER